MLSPGNPVEDQYQSEQHFNHQQCNHVIVQNSSGDTTVIFNADNTPDQETTIKSLAQNSSVGDVQEESGGNFLSIPNDISLSKFQKPVQASRLNNSISFYNNNGN